jgi:hypothetical protein
MMGSLAALGLAITLSVLLIAPALAAEAEGQPESLRDAGDLGYYIWHDRDGFHLRTTGPGPRHVFRATLRTDGRFADVRLVRLEGDDGYVIRDGGRRLDLRFETWSAVDGVDFQVLNDDRIRFELRIDGRLAPTERIFLGREGRHPSRNPFTIKL